MSDPSALHVRSWGSGDRTALLLHGQFGSGSTWREVAPRIAARGYRVVAVDLPGHGDSPADASASLGSCVDQILAACPSAEFALGHSLGSLVLAQCAHRLEAQRAVFVDSPFRYEMQVGGDEYRRRVSTMKATRTLEWLTVNRPHWSDEDRQVEARAARQFDADTSLSLMTSLSGVDHRPPPNVESMIVAPDPSDYFSAADFEELRDDGLEVRLIAGAGHTVWYGNLEPFVSAISDWL